MAHVLVIGGLNISGLLYENSLAAACNPVYEFQKKIGLVDKYFESGNLICNLNKLKVREEEGNENQHTGRGRTYKILR